MNRYFNTAGPCVPGKHYMLPASIRCAEVFHLIAREQYFVIHAARQSGKTTLLKALASELNAGATYRALYCSLESIQGIVDPREGLPAIHRNVTAALRTARGFDAAAFVEQADPSDFTNILKFAFQRLCAALDRPLIMLFDEVDCLSNGTLITFLRQLRDGYVKSMKYDYREAAPHLILQAFLQRVVNGGAHIDREFALGRRRLDLCVTIGDNRYPLELKLRDPRRSDPESEGLEQLAEYMDGCAAREGWLVIFDRRQELSWDERIGWKTVEMAGRTLHVARC